MSSSEADTQVLSLDRITYHRTQPDQMGVQRRGGAVASLDPSTMTRRMRDLQVSNRASNGVVRIGEKERGDTSGSEVLNSPSFP